MLYMTTMGAIGTAVKPLDRTNQNCFIVISGTGKYILWHSVSGSKFVLINDIVIKDLRLLDG